MAQAIHRLVLPQGDTIDLPAAVGGRLDPAKITLKTCADDTLDGSFSDRLICSLRGVVLAHYGSAGCHVSCGGLLVALKGHPGRWIPPCVKNAFVAIHVVESE
jgi:hypothetical protein